MPRKQFSLAFLVSLFQIPATRTNYFTWFQEGQRFRSRPRYNVPVIGFKPNSAALPLDVDGAQVQFTLDGSGRASSKAGTMAAKLGKDGRWAFKAVLRSGAWPAVWAGAALVNATIKNATVTLPVSATLNGAQYSTFVKATYSAESGAGGKFR